MPVLTAPSADLLGSPVSRGALSQIGKRSLSSGSGRRLARISRIPRGAIADWEEEPLLRLRAPTCSDLPYPAGRYRRLGSSIVLVWVCSYGESNRV